MVRYHPQFQCYIAEPKSKYMNEKVFDLLESTNLNWEVTKEPLFAQDGTPTNTFGVFKKSERTHLGSVGDRYEIYQNWQLAEALLIASEEVGVTFEKGGSLRDGRKVFLQAKLNDEYVGKSDVKRYITALNSHDGSSSIGLGSSNIVVVCQNTFHKAMKEITKVRHTSSAPERIKNLALELNKVIRADELLMQNFKIMAETPLKDAMIERVLRKVFEVNPMTSTKDVSTQKKSQIQSFARALDTEISLEGSNVWGLFNAVTRYTNHISAPTKGKDEYLMVGGGFKLSNLTYDTLVDMLGLEKVLA